MAFNKSNLISETINGNNYWFAETFMPINKKQKSIYFLPAFDEYFISYKDRSALIEPLFAKEVMTINGIFNPLIIVNGKITGTWKRTEQKDSVSVTTNLFEIKNEISGKALASAINSYCNFIGKRLL